MRFALEEVSAGSAARHLPERRGPADHLSSGCAAQHLRAARIVPIYEGTNGIQAAHFLVLAPGYLPGIVGGHTVLDFAPDQFRRRYAG